MEGFWSGGTGFYPSINVVGRQNVAFDDCHTALFVKGSSKILLVDNEMPNCDTIIYMTECSNSSIAGNRIHDNYGVGVSVPPASSLNIAYNNIAGRRALWRMGTRMRLYNHRKQLHQQFAGTVPYGDNRNNRFSENNFVGNSEDVCFMSTGTGRCINNKLSGNYWSNLEHDVVNEDEANPTNPSPRTSSVSTVFDPSLYPAPVFASAQQTLSPSAEPQSLEQPSTLIAVATVLVLTVALVCMLVYFKRTKRS